MSEYKIKWTPDRFAEKLLTSYKFDEKGIRESGLIADARRHSRAMIISLTNVLKPEEVDLAVDKLLMGMPEGADIMGMFDVRTKIVNVFFGEEFYKIGKQVGARIEKMFEVGFYQGGETFFDLGLLSKLLVFLRDKKEIEALECLDLLDKFVAISDYQEFKYSDYLEEFIEVFESKGKQGVQTYIENPNEDEEPSIKM